MTILQILLSLWLVFLVVGTGLVVYRSLRDSKIIGGKPSTVYKRPIRRDNAILQKEIDEWNREVTRRTLEKSLKKSRGDLE